MMHACIYKYSPFSHTTHECTMIVLPLGHSKITDNRPHPPFPANKGPPPPPLDPVMLFDIVRSYLCRKLRLLRSRNHNFCVCEILSMLLTLQFVQFIIEIDLITIYFIRA